MHNWELCFPDLEEVLLLALSCDASVVVTAVVCCFMPEGSR